MAPCYYYCYYDFFTCCAFFYFLAAAAGWNSLSSSASEFESSAAVSLKYDFYSFVCTGYFYFVATPATDLLLRYFFTGSTCSRGATNSSATNDYNCTCATSSATCCSCLRPSFTLSCTCFYCCCTHC